MSNDILLFLRQFKLNSMKSILFPFFVSIILLITINSTACTIIVAGKKATADGSILISHSDAGPDCRVHVVPGQLFKKGAYTPVFWGMVDLGRGVQDSRGSLPIGTLDR